MHNAPSQSPTTPRRATGLVMLVGASASLTAMSYLVRLSRDFEGLSAWNVAFFRFALGAVSILLISRATGQRLRTRNLRWFIIRGTIGGTTVLMYFYGITEIGLAKGTIYFHTYPLWAALLAMAVLGEWPTLGLITAAVLGFFGLGLVMLPAGGAYSVSAGDLVALGAGCLAGAAIVSIRKLRASDPSVVVSLSLCLFGMLVTGGPALLSPPQAELLGWCLLVGIGLLGIGGQLMLTWAYGHVKVSEAAPFAMLTPVMSVALGTFLLNEPVSARTLVGGSLVIAACTYASLSPKTPKVEAPS